jgi:phytoene dehydrogenase-like protein
LLPDGVLSRENQRRVASIPVSNMNYGQMKVDVALSGKLTMKRHQKWRRDDLDLRLPSHTIGTEAGMRRTFARSGAGLVPEAGEFSLWPVIPTALDPSQAPDGQDTLYLYCAVAPYRPEAGWAAVKAAAADAIVAQAAEYYDGIEDLEIGRQVLTNEDIGERVHATGGNITHVDMVLGRAGPGRPARGFGGFRTPVDGLFLSGAGTHPGGGITGAPGYNAAREVLRAGR